MTLTGGLKLTATVWFAKESPNMPVRIENVLSDGSKEIYEFSNWNLTPSKINETLFDLPKGVTPEIMP